MICVGVLMERLPEYMVPARCPGLAVLFERPTITGISEVIDVLALMSHGLGLLTESAYREESEL